MRSFAAGLALATLIAAASMPAAAAQDGAQHQENRCLCKCPDVSTVTKDDQKEVVVDVEGWDRRSIYINSTVSPADCNCPSVVLPHVNMSAAEADSFCPRCRCAYQTRNLSVIKVVVILVIWVVAILVVYMGFLSCLEPVLNRRGVNLTSSGLSYSEQHNIEDEEEEDDGAALNRSSGRRPRSDATPMSTYPGSSVVSRVGSQQTKWKRQVQEQRRNIYDRHSMLN